MIFVDRNGFPPPADFMEAAAEATEKLVAQRELQRTRKQARFTFDEKLLQSTDLREALQVLFKRKCAFCESPLNASERGIVAQFRPRERAQQMDGEVSAEHYFWLVYSWANLYASCSECRSYKGPRFPVDGQRATPGSVLTNENALVLDPCRDNPEIELAFNADGTVTPRTVRAGLTIEVFGLNRKSLIKRRRDLCERIDSIGHAFLADNNPELWTEDNFLKSVLAEAPEDWGFIALTRQHARRYLARAQAQVPKVASKIVITDAVAPSAASAPTYARISKAAKGPLAPSKKPQPRMGAVWLQRVEIENFKALRRFDLQFADQSLPPDMNANVDVVQAAAPAMLREEQPWIMLLGENGVGKSTLLKAIALALMPADQRKRYAPNPREWVSRGTRAQSGIIRLHFSVGAEPLELHFSRKSSRVVIKGESPETPVLGYGSTRLLPPSIARRSKPETVRVQNLFDSRALLRDAERWLGSPGEVKPRNFDILATSLKKLLSLADEDFIARRRQKLYANANGDVTPIRELSDGYQSVLALAIDMMLNLSKATFNMEGVEGVVLLDELEVHLHPRWKIKIVSALREVFPRVRFIATTHDPLCVQGLRKGELYVMTRQGEAKDVKIEQFDVPPGTRADQILTGAWFGVPSTRDPETVAMMREHSSLLQNRGKSAGEQSRLEILDRELRHRLDEYIGTEDEQIALQAAADVRVENRERAGAPGAASGNELREKVLEALRSKRPLRPGN